MRQSKQPHWKRESPQHPVWSVSWSSHSAMLGDSSWAGPGPWKHSTAAGPQDVLWVRCHENWAVGPDQTRLSLRWPPATNLSREMQVCVSIDHRMNVAIFKRKGHQSETTIYVCTCVYMCTKPNGKIKIYHKLKSTNILLYGALVLQKATLTAAVINICILTEDKMTNSERGIIWLILFNITVWFCLTFIKLTQRRSSSSNKSHY